MSEKYLEFNNVSFAYKKQPLCLNNINFSVGKNEKIMLLASKEMGKTTFLSVASGFIDKYNGEINFCGEELKNIIDEQKKFSLLFETPVFLKNKTVKYNIDFYFKVNGIEKIDDEKLSKLFDEFELKNVCEKKIKQLTIFEQRKLAILRSFLSEKNIVFLDDQFCDLSKIEVQKMCEIYNRILDNHSCTLFFSIGDENYKKCRNLLNFDKIDHLFYLFDSNLRFFKNIDEFEKTFFNYNQNLFFDYKNVCFGKILKENEKYLFLASDGVCFEFDEKFYFELDKLELSLAENEDVVVVIFDDLSIFNISSKDFNNFVENKKCSIFSKIGGYAIL